MRATMRFIFIPALQNKRCLAKTRACQWALSGSVGSASLWCVELLRNAPQVASCLSRLLHTHRLLDYLPRPPIARNRRKWLEGENWVARPRLCVGVLEQAWNDTISK